jgi:hypothetical protein
MTLTRSSMVHSIRISDRRESRDGPLDSIRRDGRLVSIRRDGRLDSIRSSPLSTILATLSTPTTPNWRPAVTNSDPPPFTLPRSPPIFSPMIDIVRTNNSELVLSESCGPSWSLTGDGVGLGNGNGIPITEAMDLDLDICCDSPTIFSLLSSSGSARGCIPRNSNSSVRSSEVTEEALDQAGDDDLIFALSLNEDHHNFNKYGA